jgi:hypothetical protein
VVVTVRHKFSFTQSYWDHLDHILKPVSRLVRDFDTRFTVETQGLLRTSQVIDDIEKAREVLREFCNLEWMKRVWTAQEYILASRLVCIGADLRPFTLLVHDTLDVDWLHYFETDPNQHAWDEFPNLSILNDIRSGQMDPSLAMQLALYRKTSYLEDEVYGLMAASQVVITPIKNATIDEIWFVNHRRLM